jgi:hypothetical protein
MRRLAAVLVAVLGLTGSRAALANGTFAARTHLGVPVHQVLNLSTDCLEPADAARPFFYDGNVDAPFVVPPGYSFVLTDLVLDICYGSTPSNEQKTLAVLVLDGESRFFLVRFLAPATRHLSFTAGLVVPAGAVFGGRYPLAGENGAGLRLRFQVLGYLVRGNALRGGQPFPGSGPGRP